MPGRVFARVIPHLAPDRIYDSDLHEMPDLPNPSEYAGCEPRPKDGELPLPDPFPDYVCCPVCGEAEVEVWCFREGGNCHSCGAWVSYPKPAFCGVRPGCPHTGFLGKEENG